MTPRDSRIHGLAAAVAGLAAWRHEHALTGNQAEVVLHVYDRGSASAAELAGLVAITSASMSRLLGVLEQRGWIQRRPDDGDARRSLVLPTKQLTRAIDELEAVSRRVGSSSKPSRSSRAV